MGGRQSKATLTADAADGNGRRLSERHQRNAARLRDCLFLTQRLLKTNQWRQAIEALRGLLEHLEQTHRAATPVSATRLEWNSGKTTLLKLLVEGATTCSRLLRVDLTNRYLRLAGKLASTEPPRTSDVMLRQLQTSCFWSDCQEVVAWLEKPDAKTYLESVVSANEAPPLEAQRIAIKEALVDACGRASARGDHTAAVALLQNQVFCVDESRPEAVALQCARDGMMACSSYITGCLSGEAMSREVETVVSQWRALAWPLQYYDAIVQLLTVTAEHYLSVGEATNAATKVKLIENLHRGLWADQGLVAAYSLHFLGSTASKFQDYHTAVDCHTAAYQVLEESTSEGQTGPRRMWMGIVLYSRGLVHHNLGQLGEAEDHFRRCIPLLEESRQSSDVMRQYRELVCRTIAFAYVELAHRAALRHGTSRESVMYKRLAIQHERLLEPEFLNNTLARLGHDLHYLGATEKNRGNFAASMSMFHEAEEVFIRSNEASLSGYEPFAYGYFLYYLGRFTEADELMLKAYINSLDVTDVVFFAEHEQVILTEEIQFEARHAEKKMVAVPVQLAALYFRVMSLVNLTDSDSNDLTQSLEFFQEETEKYDYSNYGNNTQTDYILTSAPCLECTCYSLLAYAYQAVSKKERALQCFERAYDASLQRGKAARLNIFRLKNLDIC